MFLPHTHPNTSSPPKLQRPEEGSDKDKASFLQSYYLHQLKISNVFKVKFSSLILKSKTFHTNYRRNKMAPWTLNVHNSMPPAIADFAELSKYMFCTGKGDSLFQYQSPSDYTLPTNFSILQNHLEVLLKYRLVDPQVQSLWRRRSNVWPKNLHF